jgi:murein L,D-transpeptidase YafK
MIISIFDFDDTLFATSHLREKIQESEHYPQFQLPELAENILKLLRMANQHGKVYIATSAQREWVEICVRDHLPNGQEIYDLVEIVSVFDDEIQKKFEIPQWKTQLFLSKFSHHFKEGHKEEIVAYGDSQYDRNAALNMKSLFPNITVKNILFEQCPSLKNLLEQQKTVISHFKYIYDYQGHLDIAVKPV